MTASRVKKLWKSDGTPSGTTLVKQIASGPASANPRYLTNVNGTLFFQASDNLNNAELWKSDGTSGGTTVVKEIRPGNYGGSPGQLTNVSGTLYFGAYDDINGGELWRSDGTAAGTNLVKDIYPGVNGSAISEMTNVGGAVYFRARDAFTGVTVHLKTSHWRASQTQPGKERASSSEALQFASGFRCGDVSRRVRPATRAGFPGGHVGWF